MLNILYSVIIYPITQILEFTFLLSDKLFKENGISIIFISFTISVLCLPLYAVAEKWQQIERETEKKLKLKVDKIKNVFKGDEQYMILSTYYRQNNYHPIYALRSSFGLLIQIPFFIAAYSYISNLEVIKDIPFLFIKDLSAPDALIPIGGSKVNLFPVVMTLINCFSGAIYAKGLPLRDKIQIYGMAGIFLILLYNSPSALALYWTINNIFSFFKNIYYRIQVKHKRLLLVGFFSAICILLAVFCIVKYSYNSKALYLTYFCIFAAVTPWIFVILNKQIHKITNIQYEASKSLSVFIISILMLWALLGLFIPSQLIVSSPQEFSFIDNYTNPLFFLFNTAIQVLGFFVFWPICLYFLFSNNIKSIFSIIFSAVSICMLINVFLFPCNYGLLSINFTFDMSPNHSSSEILINFFVLLIPLIASVILYLLKNKKIILIPITICFISLLSISAVNILKINSSFNKLKNYYVKEEKEIQEVSPIFSLSRTGKNVVIMMLDRATSVFMPFIFEESPDLKEIYSGFTFYPNTVSFSGSTFMGSPPVFGGYEYSPEEINKRSNISLVEKRNESLIMLPRIFSENGFSVCITDPPYANDNWISDLSIYDDYHNIKAYSTEKKYTDFWLMEHNLKLQKTSDIIKRNMFWYSLLKGLPLFFREPLYMSGSWCSTNTDQRLRLTLNGYAILDYLPRLMEITDNKTNTALVMTNNTTHEGSFLQAPEYVPATTVTNYGNTRFSKEHAYHVNAAAIKRLAVWLNLLKKENIYDNTRIIFVADHGPAPNFVTRIGLPFNVDHFNPLLLIKDFNSSGEIKTDMTFMTNADVPYLSLLNIIENAVNPFTGNEISMERKKKPLYIAISNSQKGINDTQFYLNPKIDYFVHDNIFDPNNWEKVEK
jgi:YidC/Oxa1 family membrane protein insertase